MGGASRNPGEPTPGGKGDRPSWAGAVAARGATGIAAELRRAILDGRYADGAQLPPERQLSRAFGAARSTIRKALRRLEEDGLVVRRVGSGTFISHARSDDVADITDVTSPLELIEVRFAIEPHMARLAVANASLRDLASLGSALALLEAAGADADLFTRHDAAFHKALALCSHNRLLVTIYGQVNEVRRHEQWRAMKDKILTPDRIAAYNQQHRALHDAIRGRDVDTAVNLIIGHLETARRHLLGASRNEGML